MPDRVEISDAPALHREPGRVGVRLTVALTGTVSADVLAPLLHHLADALTSRRVDFEVAVSGSAGEALPSPPVASVFRMPPKLDDRQLFEWLLRETQGDYVWPLADIAGLHPAGLESLADALAEATADVIVFDARQARAGVVSARSMTGWIDHPSSAPLSLLLEKAGLFAGPMGGSAFLLARRAIGDLLEATVDRDGSTPRLLALLLRSSSLTAQYLPATVLTEPPLAKRWPEPGWALSWLPVLADATAKGEFDEGLLAGLIDRWPDGRKSRWVVIAAHSFLEYLADADLTSKVDEVEDAADFLAKLLPGELGIRKLAREMLALSRRNAASLAEIAANVRSAYSRRDAAAARELQSEAASWRLRLQMTPWYDDSYVATTGAYDIYRLGRRWIAARLTFRWLDQALDASEPSPIPRSLLVASDRAQLERLIQAEPADLDLPELEAGGGLARLDRWRRVLPATDHAPPEAHPAPAATPVVHVHAEQAGLKVLEEEAALLRSELLRQDVALSAIYESTSWKVTGPLRAIGGFAKRRSAVALDAARPGPVIYGGRPVDFSSEASEAYLLRGFSDPEPWGRWTDGNVGVFRARHEARPGAARLEIVPHFLWSRGGKPVGVTLSVNGAPPRRLSPAPGEPLLVDLPSKLLRPTGLLDLCFRIAHPKGREEEPVSDRRRLGLGIRSVTFRWIDR